MPVPPLPDWLPQFRSRPPWWGGHLQTLAQKLYREPVLDAHFPSQEYFFDLNDGTDDRLVAVLYEPRDSRFADGRDRRR